MRIRLEDIPLRQETIEMSNYLNADPYGMQSAGSLLIACRDPEAMTERLGRAGINAVCIGELVPGRDRLILNDGDVRYLDRPGTDTLYPILGMHHSAEL